MLVFRENLLLMLACLLFVSFANAADTVPLVVQMPGTQPGEVGNLEKSGRCDNCHQSDNPTVTIAHDWRGSAMAHAGRDPLYWATVAIAEQVFDGAGDLCIRCHTIGGWLAGQSTPTDASTLTSADAAEGVSCDVCHTMVNPDGSEHPGVQNAPFIANDKGNPVTGFYGNGQLVFSADSAKLGPYADAEPRHQWAPSTFHRSVDYCGSCHDVSNPVVGDLAPNNGAQVPLPAADAGNKYGGSTHEQKAAFNYFPYQYGVVERTYSEYKAGLLSQTLVSDYNSAGFPADLKSGQIKKARDAALLAGTGGNYEDGTPRYFSCQTCHMLPVPGFGANKSGLPYRNDLPSHDLTGGNYWISDVIQLMDSRGELLLGGGLSAAEIAGLNAGVIRAKDNLNNAASLSVSGDTVKVINLTGHKLISGYPEGRRMWLNIIWKDNNGQVIREDGEYGPLTVSFDINSDDVVDANDVVNTLIDLDDANTKVYEAHGSITQEWAQKLIAAAGSSPSLPVSFDRVSGNVSYTLGQIAAQPAGTYHETFHFALNNKVIKDNRIPPYGMDFNEARKRNILPVPSDQYGNPSAGGAYNYWDEVTLNPPAGAASATINLMYQPTSYEYIQFLYLANNGSVVFLQETGEHMLEAWLATNMAEPYVMATTTWAASSTDTDGDGVADELDNCPNTANADQADKDSNGVGDACEPPQITGIWPASALVGETITLFVFGSYFDIAGGNEVAVNGVQQPLVQVTSTELLFVRTTVTAEMLGGPVTVTTANGTASSSINFGVVTAGLSITAIWPNTVSLGDFVVVFGSGFSPDMTVSLNGNNVFAFQILSDGAFALIVGPGDTSGFITVSTATETVTSTQTLEIIP